VLAIRIAAATAAAGLFAASWAWPTVAAAGQPETPILGEIDVDWDQPRLSVPFQVEEKRYRFELTTGEKTAFGKSFAKILAPPDFDLPDTPDIGFRAAPWAWLGGLPVRFRKPFVVCRLGDLNNTRLASNDGLVGLDILVQYILQIDFDAGKVRFLRKLPEWPGERFDIVSLQKRPRLCAVTVRAQCGSEPSAEFSVELERPDAIYIPMSAASRLAERGDLRGLHTEWSYGADLSVNYVGSAPLILGRLRTENVRTIAERYNVIGRGYLSRFLVTFDFPRGAMYLLPGKEFERTDGHDVSGLTCRMTDKGLEVGACGLDTPAFNAGLEPGDMIVEVDGHPVNLKTEGWFSNRIRRQGSTLHVRLLRADVERTVELELPPPGHEEAAVAARITPDMAEFDLPHFSPYLDDPDDLQHLDEHDGDLPAPLKIDRDRSCAPR
jgi:hypothetical protein